MRVQPQLESHEERALFTDIHYLAVVCEEDTLVRRMREGRKVTDEGWIKSSVDFNRWLKDNEAVTSTAMTLLDNTELTHVQAARIADEWMRKRMA